MSYYDNYGIDDSTDEEKPIPQTQPVPPKEIPPYTYNGAPKKNYKKKYKKSKKEIRRLRAKKKKYKENNREYEKAIANYDAIMEEHTNNAAVYLRNEQLRLERKQNKNKMAEEEKKTRNLKRKYSQFF